MFDKTCVQNKNISHIDGNNIVGMYKVGRGNTGCRRH